MVQTNYNILSLLCGLSRYSMFCFYKQRCGPLLINDETKREQELPEANHRARRSAQGKT